MSIGRVIARLQREAPRWRPTALAEVAERSRDPFRVLIACLLSLRTKDETTGPASERLFALADTPQTMLCLHPNQIERAIFPVGFYRTKARVVLGVSRDLIERFGGEVPGSIDAARTSACRSRPGAPNVRSVARARASASSARAENDLHYRAARAKNS